MFVFNLFFLFIIFFLLVSLFYSSSLSLSCYSSIFHLFHLRVILLFFIFGLFLRFSPVSYLRFLLPFFIFFSFLLFFHFSPCPSIFHRSYDTTQTLVLHTFDDQGFANLVVILFAYRSSISMFSLYHYHFVFHTFNFSLLSPQSQLFAWNISTRLHLIIRQPFQILLLK